MLQERRPDTWSARLERLERSHEHDGEGLVVASGIEPPTTSMSRRCSTTELRDYGGRERYKRSLG